MDIIRFLPDKFTALTKFDGLERVSNYFKLQHDLKGESGADIRIGINLRFYPRGVSFC